MNALEAIRERGDIEQETLTTMIENLEISMAVSRDERDYDSICRTAESIKQQLERVRLCNLIHSRVS